ncbi:MAG: hypothetical protein HYV14_08405 [Elusimicrobia bacterium]|nr:hypothetical protein [Elusimicrobiota bacterium]
MTKIGIELHDSTIEALAIEDGDLVLNCVVYVHESGDPGVAAGTGRFHDAVIRVKDFECEREEFEFPLLLDGGSLVLNGRKFDDILPYPLDEEGETALLLEPGESSEFLIRGSGIEIELHGPQGEIEAFAGAS